MQCPGIILSDDKRDTDKLLIKNYISSNLRSNKIANSDVF